VQEEILKRLYAESSLEELTDMLAHGPHGMKGNKHYEALAELECRKFEGQQEVDKAQIEAAKAATEAAEAAKATAKYTKRNALYMLLSVIAILVTSGASAVFQFLTWRGIR
jgi:hypothetical protein